MKVRRAGFTSLVAVLAIGALALLSIAVASAPAGNRVPTPTLVAYPGPDEINYGENVGYTATLKNEQTSTFTHVIYHHKVPTTTRGGTLMAADLVYSSCEPGPAKDAWDDFVPDDVYTCPERTIVAKDTATVLTVWTAPGVPVTQDDGVVCDALTPPPSSAVNDCKLTSTAYWTLKEGTGNTGSAGPDTFPPDLGVGNPMVTKLLGAAPDLTKARGYVLNACSTGASLATSTVVPAGPSNRLVTTVCATSTPNDSAFPLAPGLIVRIDEVNPKIDATNPNGKGFPTAFICIPAPGTLASQNACPTDPAGTGYTPWSFDDPSTPNVHETAGFSFTIDNTLLPNGDKVDQVVHNNVDVTSDCTIDIINSDKITIVTCKASTNGDWRFH